MTTYNHGEAFCLMQYESADGSETEVVWNSRDGVTPFLITLRSGAEARHVRWQEDERTPEDFTPPPGMRVFVDLTRERAEELARRRVDEYWDHPQYPMSAWAHTKEEWVDMLVDDYLSSPGDPDLVDELPARQQEAAGHA